MRNAEWPCHVSFIGIVSSGSAVFISAPFVCRTSSPCNGRMTSREQVPLENRFHAKQRIAQKHPRGEHFRSLVAKTLATNDRKITIHHQPRRREVVTG